MIANCNPTVDTMPTIFGVVLFIAVSAEGKFNCIVVQVILNNILQQYTLKKCVINKEYECEFTNPQCKINWQII